MTAKRRWLAAAGVSVVALVLTVVLVGNGGMVSAQHGGPAMDRCRQALLKAGFTLSSEVTTNIVIADRASG